MTNRNVASQVLLYVGLFDLPIYVQVMKGVSVISSGVRLVSLVLVLSISVLHNRQWTSASTQVVLGETTAVTGIFHPFLFSHPHQSMRRDEGDQGMTLVKGSS